MFNTILPILPQIEEFLAEISQSMPVILTAGGALPIFFKQIRGLTKVLFLVSGIAGLGLFAIPKIIKYEDNRVNESFFESIEQHTKHYD